MGSSPVTTPGLDLLQYAAAMGVGGILAYVMFLTYRKDLLVLLAQWRGQSETLMAVVKENTAAITALTIIMRRDAAARERDEDPDVRH